MTVSMRAWQVTTHGEPAGALTLTDLAIPRPGAEQILVRVKAAALNFPDVLLCRGQYQVRAAHAALTELANQGLAAPLIGGRLPLDEAPAGLTRLGAGDSVGRIVVIP